MGFAGVIAVALLRYQFVDDGHKLLPFLFPLRSNLLPFLFPLRSNLLPFLFPFRSSLAPIRVGLLLDGDGPVFRRNPCGALSFNHVVPPKAQPAGDDGAVGQHPSE